MMPAQLSRALTAISLGAILAFASVGALAQSDYPNRPITLVVPFSKGGPTDKLAQPLAPALSAALGVPVKIDYVPGNGGTKGSIAVHLNGNDGGYTVLLHNIGFASAPTLYRKLPFNAQKDFEPVGMVATAPMLILGRPGLPVDSARELWEYIKANQKTLSASYAGPGSSSQLCGLMMEQALGVKLFWIPYKGTGPALANLEKGRTDLLCDQSISSMTSVREGKSIAYAVTTPERLSARQQVLTTNETGMGGISIGVWTALFVAKGTPAAVIARLSQALQVAVSESNFAGAMESVGVVPATQKQATPDAMKALLAIDVTRLRPLIRSTGHYAD